MGKISPFNCFCIYLFSALLASNLFAQKAEQRPNIVLIVADLLKKEPYLRIITRHPLVHLHEQCYSQVMTVT